MVTNPITKRATSTKRVVKEVALVQSSERVHHKQGRKSGADNDNDSDSDDVFVKPKPKPKAKEEPKAKVKAVTVCWKGRLNAIVFV
jgi:hypothetical protein